ncbi:DivIVA domain-containing protein [Nocardiopsis ganjiahuensis]|uniref:DivIVA domain-containing protein n=1 Tax=Nocardiopsis ganjiahuensis TaxID=239984 RepID=UPI00035EE32A|nr:hypothetical protein [Nocardiopsis ganjiahuensis]
MATLKDELYQLHVDSGKLSVSNVTKEVNRGRGPDTISRATLHKVVTEPRLPDRATMTAFIQALVPLAQPPRDLGEETGRFIQLWKKASEDMPLPVETCPHTNTTSMPSRSRVIRDVSPEVRVENLETLLRTALGGVGTTRHRVDEAREKASKEGSEMIWRARSEAEQILRQAREEARQHESKARLAAEQREAEIEELRQQLRRLKSQHHTLQDTLHQLSMRKTDTEIEISRAQRETFDRLDEFDHDLALIDDVPEAEPLPDLGPVSFEETSRVVYLPSPRAHPAEIIEPAKAPSGPNPPFS